jgi:hypothetical protein
LSLTPTYFMTDYANTIFIYVNFSETQLGRETRATCALEKGEPTVVNFLDLY